MVLHVATPKGQRAGGSAGNGYFGLVIGWTVLAAAVAGGGISGGAFNPAVAIALPLVDGTCLRDTWVYLIAEIGGAAFAAGCFTLMTHPQAPPLAVKFGAEFMGAFFLMFQV